MIVGIAPFKILEIDAVVIVTSLIKVCVNPCSLFGALDIVMNHSRDR
jgi:hypothetical protein